MILLNLVKYSQYSRNMHQKGLFWSDAQGRFGSGNIKCLNCLGLGHDRSLRLW